MLPAVIGERQEIAGKCRKRSTELLSQLFNNLINCRANCYILQGDVEYLVHARPVSMRVFAAGNRPVVINNTVVIIIEKWARH